VAKYARRCFGLTTTPLRLSQVRHERRPRSRYSSLEQCTLELRRAEDLYRRNHVPFLNSSTKSVEEMSAVIMQTMKLRG
jgi:regulator of PEP synthase PpsR (kinase-PPPase family)